jgi:predicted protein tyrosine phosphatase
MWTWSLNWNEIRTDVVIGSCPMTVTDIDRICEATGANALLSLQSDECRAAFAIDYEALKEHAAVRNVRMANTPMLDFNPPDQRLRLPEAVRALTILLAAGHKVYVHCTAGINRSPLAVLGYLVFVELVSPEEALAFIRQARPAADPSWEAYEGCRQDLVDALRDYILVGAYYRSQQYPENDPLRNWYQAEIDVIRQAFLSPRSLPAARRDPCRP